MNKSIYRVKKGARVQLLTSKYNSISDYKLVKGHIVVRLVDLKD